MVFFDLVTARILVPPTTSSITVSPRPPVSAFLILFFALPGSVGRRARATRPTPEKLSPTRHYSIAHVSALRRRHACARCRRACHRLRVQFLQPSTQRVFRKGSPGGSPHLADSDCTCAQWPSWKDPGQGSKALQLQTLSAVGV